MGTAQPIEPLDTLSFVYRQFITYTSTLYDREL